MSQSGPEATLRLMIVDDHFIARHGVRGIVAGAADMEIVAEAASGVEALNLYNEAKPDVVILDLRMRNFDGIQTASALLEKDAAARILILSSYDTENDVQRAQSVNVAGYILKEAPPAELLSAIRVVAAGGQFIPEHLKERAAQAPMVTAREMALLNLIGEGNSEGEIAETLKLSKKTVNVYICKLLAKLHAKNRAEAIFEATRLGLLNRTE